MLSFTEGLAEELKGHRRYSDRAMVQEIGRGNGMPEVPTFLQSDVKDVVKQGFDACMAGEVVRVPGIANQLSALWSQTQPRWFVRTVSGLIGRQLLKP